MTRDELAIGLSKQVCPKYSEAYLTFVNEGRDTYIFMGHIDDGCVNCKTAIDHIIQYDGQCLERLAKIMRPRTVWGKRWKKLPHLLWLMLVWGILGFVAIMAICTGLSGGRSGPH